LASNRRGFHAFDACFPFRGDKNAVRRRIALQLRKLSRVQRCVRNSSRRLAVNRPAAAGLCECARVLASLLLVRPTYSFTRRSVFAKATTDSPESFRSGGEQIHVLIRSSDSVQNDAPYFRSKRDCRFNFPWSVLRCMWAFPAIALDESGVDITCYAAVMHFLVSFADEYVNVVEGELQNGTPTLCFRLC
jgi:hypothetical protein